MGRDLSALFDPKSVAVVGASDDPAKYGHAVAAQALRAPHRRPVHLVNRRGGTVLGRPAATSLAAIGEPVELVVISVPGPGFEAAVDDALACGARAIVGITAGFAETGPARAGPPTGDRRPGTRRRRRPRRPQLPRHRRQHHRALSRLGPLRTRRHRPAEPERQPRARTPTPLRSARVGLLPLRLAGQPGRCHPRRPRRGRRPARRHPGHRRLRGGLRRRPGLRRGGRRGRQTGGPAHRRAGHRLRPQRPVAHRRPDHLRRCGGRRLPGRGRRTGRHAPRDDRRPRRAERRAARHRTPHRGLHRRRRPRCHRRRRRRGRRAGRTRTRHRRAGNGSGRCCGSSPRCATPSTWPGWASRTRTPTATPSVPCSPWTRSTPYC